MLPEYLKSDGIKQASCGCYFSYLPADIEPTPSIYYRC